MAFDFNGTSQYYDLSAAGATAPPVSMSALINPDSVTGAHEIVRVRNTGTTSRMTLLTNGSTILAQSNNGTTTQNATSTATISIGTWAQVGGLFSANNSRNTVVNGVLGTANTASNVVSGINATTIGSTPGGNFFDGRIAEVAIWNVALSQAEWTMLALFISPLFIRPANLVFYAPLIRDGVINLKGGLLTATGSPAAAAHPRIIRPSRAQIRKFRSSSPSTGTGALSLRHASIAGTAAESIPGSGALALPHARVAGAGAEVFTGTGALTLGHARAAGTATEAEPGSGALSLRRLTVAGSGTETEPGSGALALAHARIAGTGLESEPGSGALALPKATIAGSGTETIAGTGALALPHARVAGAGSETFTGSGALELGHARVDGAGSEVETGTGAIELGHASIAGSATEVETGAGSLTLGHATIAGTESQSVAEATLEIFEDQDRAAFIARRKTPSGRLPAGGTGLDRRLVGTLTIREPDDRAEFEAVVLPSDRRVLSLEAADRSIFFAASVVEAASRMREAGDRAEMVADYSLWADYDLMIMELA